MRLRHADGKITPQIPLNPTPQLFQPDAVVIPSLSAGLDHHDAHRPPTDGTSGISRQRRNPRPHQLGDARVGPQTISQMHGHARRGGGDVVQHLLHFQGGVLAVAQQIRLHDDPIDALRCQQRHRFRRMRRQKLQAGYDDPPHGAGQPIFQPQAHLPDTHRRIGAAQAPRRKPRPVRRPSAGTFIPRRPPLAAMAQQHHAPGGSVRVGVSVSGGR